MACERLLKKITMSKVKSQKFYYSNLVIIINFTPDDCSHGYRKLLSIKLQIEYAYALVYVIG